MMVRRYRNVPTQSKPRSLVPVRTPWQMRPLPRRRPASPPALPTAVLAMLAVLTVLILATLNCAVLVVRSRSVPAQVVMINRLPTLTPTVSGAAIALAEVPAAPAAVFSPTPLPTVTLSPVPVQNQAAATSTDPVVQAVQQAAPTPTPWTTPTIFPTNTPLPPPSVAAPTAAPAANPGGWSFAAMRVDAVPVRKMLMLYGEMINDTGAAQKLTLVTGTFYDSQDQVIAADKSTYGLWPTSVVPPGGRVPFALTVYDIKEAGNFQLSVQSEPTDAALRQDFEFLAVNEQTKGNKYCLAGTLKNPGGALEKQLVIAAILYDEQGNVLRFVDDNKTAFKSVVGDQTLDFEVCVKSPPNNVARHELRAWGI